MSDTDLIQLLLDLKKQATTHNLSVFAIRRFGPVYVTVTQQLHAERSGWSVDFEEPTMASVYCLAEHLAAKPKTNKTVYKTVYNKV